MTLNPRFFAPIGTLRHADRLGFLTQDVRAAGTVLGFFGAAAALGARPEELALLVCRRHSPNDLHRQIVLVFHKDAGFADSLARIYRAHNRPLGFEAQRRWCAIPEPSFLPDETFALLAARFPTLLLIEEDTDGRADVAVYASAGFREHPKLKLAPLGQPRPGANIGAKVMAMPRRAPPPILRPQPRPTAMAAPAAVVPLRPRKLKSVVALNETVERQVVNEFRRLLKTVAQHS
ncbi:MAG: hypothetical protein OJJ21_16220 [Ferrovibrio sp.]|uniref:hypothetical protein n=1 Tax=Ferrovibrio sp. TaxID=1917215 RepID=UPI00262E7538|nr:hypothetical protein [Ferrovibrio sp.]MCW0235147.1 hypothetical protein [Ferrovibrio sp.]